MRTSTRMIVLAGLLAGSAASLAADTDVATAPPKAAAVDAAPADAASLRQQMQDNMRAMQEEMAKIHASKDPAERHALMAQHMRAMHEQMRLMHGNMGGGMQGGMQGGMGGCGQMGSGHMGMMQMMMDQMQQHADAEDGAPKSK